MSLMPTGIVRSKEPINSCGTRIYIGDLASDYFLEHHVTSQSCLHMMNTLASTKYVYL